jgi:opacity protein-like surface antigen
VHFEYNLCILKCQAVSKIVRIRYVLNSNLTFLGGQKMTISIKTMSIYTLFVLSAFLPFKQALSEDIDYNGPFVKLLAGVNSAMDSDFNGSSSQSFPSGEASLDAGPVYGMAGGYRFGRNFATEIEYVFRSNDIDKITGMGGEKIADGDLASVAIMANGYYYFDFAKNWSPYIGIGIGYLQEIDSDVKMLGKSDQTDLEDQVFAWQAMVGAEVPLDESWRFYGEGRFMTAPGPELNNSNGSYDIDYENISLIVGIGYQF